MKNGHLYCLGVGTSHDGSVCLLKDGKIAVAIEKERLSRIKHDGGNPADAINYCLDTEGITMEDIDVMVTSSLISGGDFLSDVSRNSIGNVRQVTISHHLAHAYSAIGFCNYENFNVLVIDGNGTTFDHCDDLTGCIVPDREKINADVAHQYYEKDSYYKYVNNKLEPVYKDFSVLATLNRDPLNPTSLVHSIGGFYAAASIYCFNGMEDPGKLMGLAPYGRKSKIKLTAYHHKDGRVFVNHDVRRHFNQRSTDYQFFKQNFQYYADFAYWVQKQTEKAIGYVVDSRLAIHNAGSLCYAGGVALNAVANSHLKKRESINNLTMVPSAGDNGIAMGCAYYGWLEVLKQPRVLHDQSSAFGCQYSNTEIKNTLDDYFLKSYENKKTIIDTFFRLINNKAYHKVEGNESLALTFNIVDYGVYQVKIENGELRSTPFVTEEAKCNVTARVIPFLNALLLRKYYSSVIERSITASNPAHLLAFKEMIQWEEVSKALLEIVDRYPVQYYYSKSVEADTAKLLAGGKIVGWFQEGSEFGPRALGRRSILADPGRKGVRDFINSRVKFREDFRPFAPSVLKEDVTKYFETKGESPYMILVDPVKKSWKNRIESVVHVDGTCRVQTVTRDWNEKYYNLLTEFKSITGVSVLLNTSLNRKGTPIVETPEDALDLLYESEIDYMVIGNFIVTRESKEVESKDVQRERKDKKLVLQKLDPVAL
jgi:predicted NodU family carbamoyl transferase